MLVHRRAAWGAQWSLAERAPAEVMSDVGFAGRFAGREIRDSL